MENVFQQATAVDPCYALLFISRSYLKGKYTNFTDLGVFTGIGECDCICEIIHNAM